MDFTLSDLQGTVWTFRELWGKVVLVNFWATGVSAVPERNAGLERILRAVQGSGICCAGQFRRRRRKATALQRAASLHCPILLDPGRKVHEAFNIEGIPGSLYTTGKGS